MSLLTILQIAAILEIVVSIFVARYFCKVGEIKMSDNEIKVDAVNFECKNIFQ